MLLFPVVVAHLLQAMHGRAGRWLDQLTAALAVQATRDELTELLNRCGLHEAALQTPIVGVLHLDVDRFKQINDELGHAAGDAVLVEVAERLHQLADPRGLVAWVRGDKFVVVLPTADSEHLALLSHRARIGMAATASVLQLPWTVSVGAALPPANGVLPHGDRLATLLQAADLAMYQDQQARRTDPLLDRRQRA